MEKLLESMDEMATEGWEAVKYLGNFLVMVIVFAVMCPLYVIGWLKRHLTSRVPDVANRGAKKVKSKK